MKIEKMILGVEAVALASVRPSSVLKMEKFFGKEGL
jgi:hypothetical protein